MTIYQPGEYDHSVLYTTAPLTEGRSARDQPKQPPAKKKAKGKENPKSKDFLHPSLGPACPCITLLVPCVLEG